MISLTIHHIYTTLNVPLQTTENVIIHLTQMRFNLTITK